jgi:hypothetical protein
LHWQEELGINLQKATTVQSRTIHASALLMYRPSTEAISSNCLFSIYQRQEKFNKKGGTS